MRNHKDNQQSLRDRHILMTQFGTRSGKNLLIVVVLIATLGWSADSILEVMTLLRNTWGCDLEKIADCSGWGKFFSCTILAAQIGSFPVAALWVFRSAKRYVARAHLSGKAQTPPDVCQSLILFLSLPKQQDLDVLQRYGSEVRVNINDIDHSHDLSSWRMPLTTLEKYKTSLQQVWILGSPQVEKMRGSFPLQNAFISVCKHVIPELERVQFNTDDQLLTGKSHVYSRGVDFENLEQLVDVLERIRVTSTSGLPFVDITGGQKLASVAGALTSQEANRKFLYVNSRYQIAAFDIEYTQADTQ
ncbi:MAG: hypothetical protein IPM37_15690 [Hahellaceae bacterium]|nr:hypothetical protein [Hahellaceae bacterium]